MGRFCAVTMLLFVFQAQSAPPEWFQKHLTYLVADNGRWVADNSAYRSADEPLDAYALEWRWGLGQQSVTGRLFGLVDGNEAGDFWQFRVFWHPAKGQAVIQQFAGHGAIAMGTLYPAGPDHMRLEQDMIMPDGSVTRVGHDTKEKPGVQDGWSFDIQPDGSWQQRRHYVWRLQP